MTAMGSHPDSPKVSHTWSEILTRHGRKNEIPEPFQPDIHTSELWHLFWHFSHRRKGADGNSFAIEYLELFAYMHVTGEVLSTIEVDTIIAMDDAFRAQLAETRDAQRKFNEPNQAGKPLGKGKGSRRLKRNG